MSLTLAVLVVVPTLGCARGDADTGTITDPFADWTPPAAGDPTPPAAWDAPAAAQALQAGLTAGFVTPAQVLRAYLSRMALGDERCPGDARQIMSDRVAMQGCVARSGTEFSGITTYILPPEGGFVLTGDFRIAPPDDSVMEGGGAVVVRVGDDGATLRRKAEVGGTWRAVGEPGLLGEGVSAQLRVELTDGGGQLQASIDGSWGAAGRAISFEQARLDVACGPGLRGRIGVRDPNGGWWTWRSETCDGCGLIAYEGGSTEAACLATPGLAQALTTMVTP